jgi:subtilisin family serine protease
MIKNIILVSLLIFLYGCNSNSEDESTNNIITNNEIQSNTEYITSILIDSVISGVYYQCGDDTGFTDSNGEFTCKENTQVYFAIGGINLGNITIDSSNKYITPAMIFGLDNTNISDIKVTNFLQLVQSLDSDDNVTNGIDINETIQSSFLGYSLDLTDPNITEDDLNKTINHVNKNLILKHKAVGHYIETLTNTLDVKLQDEPYYEQQWYLEYNSTIYTEKNIDINASINIGNILKTYSGKGIKIAIIDNGLDTSHEDLEGAISNTYDISTQSTDVSHNNINDNHGTAVTGIIGARVNGIGIQGIASNSEIIFLKYEESMSDSQIIELFNKAQEFGADIINCSWGTYDVSLSVKEKIQDLAINGRNGKGISIVFAVGNDDQDMGNDESSIPEVISVGASDKDNLRAWYSNHGENLDILAPGGFDIGITTIDNMGVNGQASIDEDYLLYDDSNSFIGTSASAPIVSGIIALILEKNPNLTRVQIEQLLQSNSDKIGNEIYENNRNNYYGYGKVNLSKIFDNI